ncbi:hypothetical protein BDV25DRAFT_154185 [Aspergillus avenaceus]|uniref:Muramidase n=1 Tax=Aspergillus avenaceus TaxID=36643 RepID=A0A5N6TW18_ASPAV|nr:hypothetical protein BDV25DRAFT_154185 [Aspergillus avenaceus]
MNATKLLRPVYTQLRRSTLCSFRSVPRLPTITNYTSHPAKRLHFHSFHTTMSTPDDDRPLRPSKRDPTVETEQNSADELERLLQKDRFKTWGFVIYRCTYESDSDWEKFMSRFLYHITDNLEFYNGLDLLDNFAPTVFEDRSFDGADTASLRKHFQEWAVTAPQEEQGADRSRVPDAGRYRFFIMVDQEALESVLNAPDPASVNKTGFVRLVNGLWKPDEPDEEELAELGVEGLEEEEPLEGCTLEDVGWMKVLYDEAETWAYLNMGDTVHWSTYYVRPPLIQKNM